MKTKKQKNNKEKLTGIKKLAQDEKEIKESKADDIKYIYSTSYPFPDGRLAEMIHDPQNQTTEFLVLEKGNIYKKQEVPLGETVKDGKRILTILKPFGPFNDMVKYKFIKLANGVSKYDDNLKLFKEVKQFIRRYVIVPDEFETVASVYVMMTWIYDQFQTLPYLRVVGLYGTGKTRFLQTVGNLCFKSMIAGGSVTLAAVFRTLSDVHGTFVFDEADFKNSEFWSEIVKILNGGHTVDFPVIRMEANKNDKYKTKVFDVYGPKILGSRERFKDVALESRCLSQQLLPIENKNKVPIHLPKSFESEARALRNKLLLFRFKNFSKIKADETTLKGVKFPRLRQSSLALTTVAKMVSDDVLKEVLKFLSGYERELSMNQSSNVEADILKCVVDILNEHDPWFIEKGKIYVKDVAEKFNSAEYEAYSDKETRNYDSKDHGPLEIKAYKVSERKIGAYLEKIGIPRQGDRQGRYIDVGKEFGKIIILAKRHGLEQIMKLPTLKGILKKKKEIEERYKEREKRRRKELVYSEKRKNRDSDLDDAIDDEPDSI